MKKAANEPVYPEDRLVEEEPLGQNQQNNS